MGAKNLGRIQSEETLSKKAEANRAYYKTHYGPNLGKVMGLDQKSKISETLKASRNLRVQNTKASYLEYCASLNIKVKNPDQLPELVDKQLKVDLICSCGESYSAKLYELEFGNKTQCRSCSATSSTPETDIFNFLVNELEIPSELIVRQARPEFMEGEELDLYIPDKKIAIEYHGLAFHSERPVFASKSLGRIRTMHRDKYLKCKVSGVKLIQIFEDEWLGKKDIVKSILRVKLGQISVKFNGRDCEVRIIENKLAFSFFEENHVSGGVLARVAFGIYRDDKLISAISLRRLRSGHNTVEIARFASIKNTIVHGAFQKLLKCAEQWALDHGFLRIATYADLRFGEGFVYESSGFKRLADTKPNYFYEKGQKRVNRFGMRKSSELPGSTEREQRNLQGWYAIYDAGNAFYLKELISNTNGVKGT